MMDYKNILIIKMSSLGDVIHALPFAAALRQTFPNSKISWLVHPQFSAFVPEPPIIDEILYFDKAAFGKMGWGKRWETLKKTREMLHSRHFDLVIDLQGLFKSAVMAWLTGCPNRIGYCEMREGSGLISRAITGPNAHRHVIERYLDVARYLGAKVESITYPMPALTEEMEEIRLRLIGAGIPDKEGPLPYVVFVPGARWDTKRWPLDHYAALAKKFLERGLYVVLAGGPGDAPLGEAILQQVGEDPRLIDFIGKTSLRELGALIKGCRFYVSGDTGPLHIATALQKPLVTMYGPTRPDRTGPYGNPQATVLLSPAACAGCLKKHCDHWTCMGAVTPEQVFTDFLKKEGKACD
ncbi:lipopolysaccharide heptosyltransferase II [Acidaminococcus timonensis]|jgi:heptosyltransferase I|uniref:lipopolysaccharide heptosyltransferase II n=1 Tax=Acidaminococcus timonensis TaxID=1871002 RepID=UPI003A5C1F18